VFVEITISSMNAADPRVCPVNEKRKACSDWSRSLRSSSMDMQKRRGESGHPWKMPTGKGIVLVGP
jgi:hypothetical protein